LRPKITLGLPLSVGQKCQIVKLSIYTLSITHFCDFSTRLLSRKRLFNAPVDFLAQVGFPAYGGTPKVFRIFGGCGTRRICSGKCSLTSSPSQCCRFAPLGLSENTQAALAKTSIRCENRQVHFSNMTKTKNPKPKLALGINLFWGHHSDWLQRRPL